MGTLLLQRLGLLGRTRVSCIYTLRTQVNFLFRLFIYKKEKQAGHSPLPNTRPFLIRHRTKYLCAWPLPVCLSIRVSVQVFPLKLEINLSRSPGTHNVRVSEYFELDDNWVCWKQVLLVVTRGSTFLYLKATLMLCDLWYLLYLGTRFVSFFSRTIQVQGHNW